jgi:hypothetical protein
MMRILMTSSAVFLATLGLGASFLPRELLAHAASPANTATIAGIQLAGAVWVGFALVNWAARGTLIGGIYGRPIALGNFAHFAIGAIALVKGLPGLHWCGEAVAAAALYTAFAAWFGYALFSAGPRATSRPA